MGVSEYVGSRYELQLITTENILTVNFFRVKLSNEVTYKRYCSLHWRIS